MLQFPYAVYPEGQALDGEIDNNFSCTISGTVCAAYQIYIYNNSTNKIVYTGEKTSTLKYNEDVLKMSVPANSFSNGEDLIWKMRLWTNNPDMQIASNKVLSYMASNQIAIEPYSESRIKAGHKIKIRNNIYNISEYILSEMGDFGLITIDTEFDIVEEGDQFKIYSDFIDTPTYYFKSRTLPEISISNLENTVSSRNYSFIGSYFQNENTPLQYYIFNLYDNLGELIDTTDKVYSSNIVYNFDGFTNEESYGIELICGNQDNIEISTGIKKFVASYFQPNVDLGIGCEVLEDKDAIRLILQPDKTSIPEFNGEYEIVQNSPFNGTNSAKITGSSLVYNNISQEPIEINESSFSVFLSTKLNNDFEGKIIELSGDNLKRYIEFIGYTFYDNKNGVQTKLADAYSQNKFVIQSEQESDTGYVWDNSKSWDNSKYWWIPKEKLNSKQFKITILPNSSEILEV